MVAPKMHANKQTGRAQSKRKKQNSGSSSIKKTGLLDIVSPEILHLILEELTEPKDMAALSRTCKTIHPLMSSRLYRRVIVSAEHFGQIPAMIRTVERFLSIRQKKEIKKLGKYKGQQETYPAGVNEHEVPKCTQFVQELVIGNSSPGKKHNKIVHRYIEEFCNNMTDIRVLEANMLTPSIAKRIPSWKKLIAFSADCDGLTLDVAQYFNGIRALRHLAFSRTNHSEMEPSYAIRNLLSRSAGTLRTLQFSGSGLSMVDGKPLFTPQNGNNEASLGSFDSIHISNSFVNAEGANAMLDVVDFTKLSEIEFHHVSGSVSPLYRPLEEAFTRASTNRSAIKVRHLAMNADFDHGHHARFGGESAEVMETARFGFLSSFSQLTSLEISNYGFYPERGPEPIIGVPDLVIDAILKHKQLKTLKFTYWTGTAKPFTYLSSANLSSLITGLPELEHFQFYPYEWKINEFAPVLTLGDFRTITVGIYELGYIYDKSNPLYMTMEQVLQAVLRAYLEYSGPDCWETKMEKLRTITMRWQKWCISTQKFPKGKIDGMKRLGTVQTLVSEDKSRTIWYQEVLLPSVPRQGYDTGLTWVKKAVSYR